MRENHRPAGSPELYDSNGNPLKWYYQWDLNQEITIKGLSRGSIVECHFAKSSWASAYVVVPTVSGKNYITRVPNKVFASPGSVFLYIYVSVPSDGQRTRYEFEIPVNYRAKPEDYIEPPPEEWTTMRSMLLKAEGYAVGTHNGIPVPEDDPAYENNAKYYAEQAGSAVRKPYLSLERVSRYLYNVSFKEAPPDTGVDSLPGFCSSHVQNGRLYRNLDWYYDRNATFHVTLPGIDGLAFIDGLTDNNLDDELIGQLPYHLVDGVNEHGVMVSTHVLYNDWDAVGTGEIPLTYLPYIALTRVKSMATIETDLAGVLDNFKSTPALIASEYLIQVLVTDGETSYVLRPKEQEELEYEAVDISENPKLSNFLWVADTAVVRQELQERPTGVERWNMMPCPLEELRFTKAYEVPTRLSEFIGLRGTTKDSTDAELLDIYTEAHGMYEDRERDGSLWQTMHSVVYSPKGMEHLWIQENWEKDYIVSTASGGSGDLSYVHQQMTAASVWNITHNLGKYPSVTVVDSGGSVVIGETSYINTNQVRISFMSAFSGIAYFN